MRIAVVSDIHGNLTALEAVLRDVQEMSPDVVFHGGDLADGGSSPVEVVDRIRELGWQGVIGNTDEMLTMPETLTEFAKQSPTMQPLVGTIEEMAAFTRARLGDGRLAWLRTLPQIRKHGEVGLVHASPTSRWKAPGPEASDAELEKAYGPIAMPICVYGHIHRSFIRSVAGMTVINSGSVSLSYDGDRRSAYLLLDDGKPTIRRVEYDVNAEIAALKKCGMPRAEWIARILANGFPQAL